jgi:putative ABC transport system permease protein
MTAHVQPALLVLLGAVALMVLAACANVANLVLIRNTNRAREFAVRAALGASRGRLLRQNLAESMVLGLAGGIGGVLLALWAVKLIATFGPQDVPRLSEVQLDGYVLAFAICLSLATAALFGAIPAAQACSTDPNESLKEGAKGTTSSKGTRLRSALVVAEVSLALMLLAGGGLLANSFVRLSEVSPGFDVGNVLTMSLFLSPAKYNDHAGAIAPFLEEVAKRVRAVPGVISAAIVDSLPVKGGVSTDFEIVGRPKTKADLDADVRIADENYLDTMRIPLLRGRWFSRFDTEHSTKVIVISAAMAQKYWPNENPIGAQVTMLDWGPPLTGEIVGVVGDIKDALDQPASSFFYWPERQFPSIFANLVVKTSEDPVSMVSAVKAAVWSVDRNQSVASVQTMEQVLANSLARHRMQTALVGAFASLALLMAIIGIFGVMAYSVSERTREMGIRIALGANARSVRSLVLRQGLWLTCVGSGIGLAGAVALAGALSNQLYGLEPRDPATLASVTLLLGGIAVAACYIPAWRATRVDPVVALRHE